MIRFKNIFLRAAVLAAACSAALALPSFAGEWKRSEQSGAEAWWYDLGDGKYAVGWKWLDGDGDGVSESYYFDSDGWLLTNTVTPDGYRVNEDGAWVDGANVRIRVDFAPGESREEEEELPAPSGMPEEEVSSEGPAPSVPGPSDPGEEGPGQDAAGDVSMPEVVPVSGGGSDIVDFARQYVGKLRYVYGGYSLESGVDCSAFTKLIFEHFGKELPRGTGDQLTSGQRISGSEAVPGDLVFWANGSGRIYHVGILSGNGKFIHASNTARGWVFEDNLYDMPAPAGYARY